MKGCVQQELPWKGCCVTESVETLAARVNGTIRGDHLRLIDDAAAIESNPIRGVAAMHEISVTADEAETAITVIDLRGKCSETHSAVSDPQNAPAAEKPNTATYPVVFNP